MQEATELGLTWGQIITVIALLATWSISLFKVWGNINTKIATIEGHIAQGRIDHLDNKLLINKNRDERQEQLNCLTLDNKRDHTKLFDKVEEVNKMVFEIKGLLKNK